MDITFNCDKCGQSLAVDEVGAGQLVDCPKCGESVAVPEKPKPLATANTRLPHPVPPRTTDKKCPFCAEMVKAEAKVCRFCGYDFVTRQRSATSSAGTPSPLPKILTVLVILAVLGGSLFAYKFWKAKAGAPFFTAAKEALDEIHKMQSAVENGLNFEQYGAQLIASASKKDNLLRVADATGKKSGSNEDKFCAEIIKAQSAYWNAGHSWEMRIQLSPRPYSELDEKMKQEMQGAWHEASESVAEADKLYSKIRE